MKIKIQKIHPDAKLPMKSTDQSGGWDVFCTEVIKESDDFYICKLGLIMQPSNPNYKITLVPRSSITKTHLILQNSPGLGDPDFLGEYQYRFRVIPVKLDWKRHHFQYPEFPYKPGDRIGQIYLEEIIPIEWEETSNFLQTDRGQGGFGSTGK